MSDVPSIESGKLPISILNIDNYRNLLYIFSINIVLSGFVKVHVVAESTLREFGKAHPDAVDSLHSWYSAMDNNNFRSFAELKQVFPSADKDKDGFVFTYFDIKGNTYRISAIIRYNKGRVFIHDVCTHAEYSKTWANLKWKTRNFRRA